MQFTSEHEELRRTIERFVEQELNPHVDEWEEAGIFPAHEVFRKLGELGLLGLTKPEAYGGAGLDYSYSVLMAETLGNTRCGGVPMAIGVQTDMATPALARFGSDELRAEFLAPAIAGTAVACIGVSEPGAGSDVASIRTTARKDGDDYVISGGKLWITNGTQADWMCCLANTSEGSPHRNKSLIIVPMKSKGVSIERKLRKIGMNSSDTAQIHFDDVRVPRRHLIGEEGHGFTYQMLQFQEERLWGAANALMGLDHAVARHDRVHAQPEDLRPPGARQPGRAFHARRTADRDRGIARSGLSCNRAVCRGTRRHAARVDGQAQSRAVDPRGGRQVPAVLGRHGLHLGEPGLAAVP